MLFKISSSLFIISLTSILFVYSAPNILIYYVDDLYVLNQWTESHMGPNLNGYTVEYYDIPVPNIDAFRNEAIVFPRAYAGAPACAPSRYCLLTGRVSSRNEYGITQTLSRNDGSTGTRVFVPWSKLDGGDNTYNLPQTLKANGYYTGVTGKWHLLPRDADGIDLGYCITLAYEPDETVYNDCTNLVQQTSGFDFVDAFYEDNMWGAQRPPIIPIPTPYGHNPEWILYHSLRFLDEWQSAHSEQPFFLYLANTLTHNPAILDSDALDEATIVETPKGNLSAIGDEIPNNTGMKSRAEMAAAIAAQGYTDADSDEHELGAKTMWLDDQFGALVTYLKDNNLYDNTFIIFANDHGQFKMTLYEQGLQMVQFVRYPPLFSVTNGPYIVPDDFIVSNYDIPATLFELAGISVPTGYVMDGQSWLADIEKAFNQPDPSVKQTCCSERYADIFSTRAIVSENYKYIFKATDETASDASLYADASDTEQLYDLDNDPSEQTNVISTAETATVAEYKDKMAEYIVDIACQAEDKDTCVLPDAADCTHDSRFTKTWNGAIEEEWDDYDVDALLDEAKTEFLEQQGTGSSCNIGSFDNIDISYEFDFTGSSTVFKLSMTVCCEKYRTLNGDSGSAAHSGMFDVDPGTYTHGNGKLRMTGVTVFASALLAVIAVSLAVISVYAQCKGRKPVEKYDIENA